MLRTNKIIARLDDMLTDAINGSFIESDYDETELSRLENKFRQYLTGRELSAERVKAERESIKELVTDISHQTKTPIANICLYTQLLEEGCTEEMLPVVRQIRRQAEKLEFLLRTLSKISRLESDMICLRPGSQPVGPLVDTAVEAVRGKAAMKKMKLRIAGPKTAQAVFDMRWTREALENLLDNAVKYGPAGSTVTVSVRVLELFVQVCVTDEGQCIPEEERAQIFERFYRGQNARQEEGNGVGLYLTRMILQREGGYVKVTSGEDGGNCFCMYLQRIRIPEGRSVSGNENFIENE